MSEKEMRRKNDTIEELSEVIEELSNLDLSH